MVFIENDSLCPHELRVQSVPKETGMCKILNALVRMVELISEMRAFLGSHLRYQFYPSHKCVKDFWF